MRPSSASSMISTDTASISGTSSRISWRATSSGATSALRPRISRTLAMLLPTTLPTAMAGAPRSAASTPIASSGALVPNATTVRPTTSGDKPVATASRAAPRIISSAPPTSSTRPTISSSAVCTPPQ
jgi:hypothetical protein